MSLTPSVHPLGQFDDLEALFDLMADRSWAVWLDSGRHSDTDSRYDFLACEPAVTLVTRGRLTEVSGDTCYRLSPRNPLELLREELVKRSTDTDVDLPIPGGALGYFAYDLGRRFEDLPDLDKRRSGLPTMSVGLYDWLLVRDRQTSEVSLVVRDNDPYLRRRVSFWLARFRQLAELESPETLFSVIEEPTPDVGFDDYAAAFETVQHYLQEGDCYQVNLAQRFQAKIEGSPWGLYRILRKINPAPFSAFLNYPWGQILSASPERFLSVCQGVVETKPIKGTRPRSMDMVEDERLATELKQSHKDRAENVMIVDLLRNDLGRSCEFGSVRVPKLFEVESFATVHHLVSTVIGKLKPGFDALHLLQGSFPGGSITGAPKVRAMEVIEELESARRELYCGSIGYIGYNGAMDSNIVIRTLLHQAGAVTYWAGGGLVIDSKLEDEYQETLDKGFAMQRVLQKVHDD